MPYSFSTFCLLITSVVAFSERYSGRWSITQPRSIADLHKVRDSILALADLICRNCGHTVTTANALKNVSSELALDSYTMEVLGQSTLVQVFRNPVREFIILANDSELTV